MSKKFMISFLLILAVYPTVLPALILASDLDQRIDQGTIIKTQDPEFDSEKINIGKNQTKESNNNVIISEDPATPILIENEEFGIQISIDIPYGENVNKIEDNKKDITYKTSDSNFSTKVEVDDSALRQIYTISENYSKENIPIVIDGVDDLNYKILNSGGVYGYNSSLNEDEQYGVYLNSPWAIDAEGKNLPTEYIIKDGILYQSIDYADAVFPVTADPVVAVLTPFLMWVAKVAGGWFVTVVLNVGLHKGCQLYNDKNTAIDYVCDSTNHYRDKR